MKRYEIVLGASFIATVALVAGTSYISASLSFRPIGDPATRQRLFELIQPVAIMNCDLKRFGEPNDGGYALCANLLSFSQGAYSYGISGYDGWGCDVSTAIKAKVHQYDCFDTRQPACPSGEPVFHAECVAASSVTDNGKVFDSIDSQITRNGDAGKNLVVKMDVEGAEWDSLLGASESTLSRIDQLAIEFHYVGDPKFVKVLERLKQHFYVAHLHFNNFSCRTGIEPFPALAYEVLFVSKRLTSLASAGTPPGLSAFDAPNDPTSPDCQPTSGGSKHPQSQSK